MNNAEIVQALKNNEKPFGLMTEEMRVYAGKIGGGGCFIVFSSEGWIKKTVTEFFIANTYRLRPDYKEPQEVVEREVYEQGNELYYDYGKTGTLKMFCAIANPDFIGFKYEDGIIAQIPRLMRSSSGTGGYFDTILHKSLNGYEVLTPTHVLFKGKDNG